MGGAHTGHNLVRIRFQICLVPVNIRSIADLFSIIMGKGDYDNALSWDSSCDVEQVPTYLNEAEKTKYPEVRD